MREFIKIVKVIYLLWSCHSERWPQSAPTKSVSKKWRAVQFLSVSPTVLQSYSPTPLGLAPLLPPLILDLPGHLNSTSFTTTTSFTSSSPIIVKWSAGGCLINCDWCWYGETPYLDYRYSKYFSSKYWPGPGPNTNRPTRRKVKTKQGRSQWRKTNQYI